MDQLDDDPRLSVGILTGAGGTFCARHGSPPEPSRAGERRGQGPRTGLTERPPVKPLDRAAVEGYALAGGTELALATDLIVAARNSAFGIPGAQAGLVAAGGGLLRLPQRDFRPPIAMELALTGDQLSAERAHELGMVNVLAEPGMRWATIALAERITANGPLAVAATKRIIVESRGWNPEDQWREQMKIIMPVFRVQRRQGGAIAFAEAAAELDGS